MIGCFLRIHAESGIVDGLVGPGGGGAAFGLERVRRADWSSPHRTPDVETLRAVVCGAEDGGVERQIEAATSLLRAHGPAIRAMVARVEVRAAFLDFCWEFPVGTPGRWARFPLDLINRCAETGVELEVSVFAVPPE